MKRAPGMDIVLINTPFDVLSYSVGELHYISICVGFPPEIFRVSDRCDFQAVGYNKVFKYDFFGIWFLQIKIIHSFPFTCTHTPCGRRLISFSPNHIKNFSLYQM